jgi:uncharacterized membrane protein YphA (DoxX/SURF4 family)
MLENMLNFFRKKIWFNYFIVFTRVLIGFSFIPSGLVKAYGQPFTTLPTTMSIGYFFDAMYKTGVYWNFIGVMQITAGFLLITQRFATLGALLFFAIISNIFCITVGLDFGNTNFITGLLFLAAILLLLWDYQKIKLLFLSLEDIKKQQFTEDLISKTWTYYGIGFFIFALLFCQIPYIIGKHNISAVYYILIPTLINMLIFLIVLRYDFKKYKRSNKKVEL